MITHIIGEPDTNDDNNPIFVRRMQIQTSGLPEILGYIPSSPVYYAMEGEGGQPTRYWQYFPNGMIVWSFDTCAHVLYGPILDFYAGLDQFNGPLGAPRTDILTLPDGAVYAVFEEGVLYMAKGSTVEQLTPVSDGLIKTEANVDPSINGIVALAQSTMTDVAAAAIANSKQLQDQVQAIYPTVWFNSMAPGGCENPGFNSPGIDLLPAHVFNVHLNILPTGCASNTGEVSADLLITIRMSITNTTLSARMFTYDIYHVFTFGGFGDSQLKSALTNAFNAEYDRDLFSKQLPSGINLLSALIDPLGNVSIYVEPICTSNNLSNTFTVYSGDSANHVRKLRDEMLTASDSVRGLVKHYYTGSPLLYSAIAQARDGENLKSNLAKWLDHNFRPDTDPSQHIKEMGIIGEKFEKLMYKIDHGSKQYNDGSFSEKALTFLRLHVHPTTSFSIVMKELNKWLDNEILKIKN